MWIDSGIVSRTIVWIIVFAFSVVVELPAVALAQGRGIPDNSRADSLFTEGVTLFRSGQFAKARLLFKGVETITPLHTETTAAALMAAKAAYRLGDFRTTSNEMSRFINDYPSSGYLDDARTLLTLAGTVLNRMRERILSMGIILSLDEDEVAQTQALFNGIRFAVDEYNRGSLDHRIRMVFRDTKSRPARAAQAVDELAAEGVEFIVGALYSEEAIAAAAAAEKNKIVFIAPLATDERVSKNRQYAFQANPSIRMRGRLMAQFAVNGLRLQTLGVLATEDPERVGERLTDSFIEEASRLGADINFVSVLDNLNQWVRLFETIPADTLKYMEAMYVPVTAVPSEDVIGALFSSLDRLRAHIRLLGNSSYHNLPMRTDASRYLTTYSNDFYLDSSDPRVISFGRSYGEIHDDPPDRLVYAGYDVTSFVLQTLEFAQSEPLVDVLRDSPIFDGIASRIGFQGGNVNRSMFFLKYSDGELNLLR